MQLPDDLQKRIEQAKELPEDARNVRMMEHAQEIVLLGDYEQAFSLVNKWVEQPSTKVVFSRSALITMIYRNIPTDKIIQLAKTLEIDESQIFIDLIALYVVLNQMNYAVKLVSESEKPNFYFDKTYDFLVRSKKLEHAANFFKLFSLSKINLLRSSLDKL